MSPLLSKKRSNHYKCGRQRTPNLIYGVGENEGMKQFIGAVIFVMLLMPLAAGQTTFEGEVASMSVGENVTVNATVVNPLPIEDTLRVVFEGPAIEGGLVTPFYPDNDIDCEQLQSRCDLKMEPNEQKDVRIILEGTAIGQEVLTGTVNSTTTQLSSTDRMEIRVQPYFGRVTVSAPGIQELQIIVLGLLAALAAGYFFRS